VGVVSLTEVALPQHVAAGLASFRLDFTIERFDSEPQTVSRPRRRH
jgi:hypothetical protein